MIEPWPAATEIFIFFEYFIRIFPEFWKTLSDFLRSVNREHYSTFRSEVGEKQRPQLNRRAISKDDTRTEKKCPKLGRRVLPFCPETNRTRKEISWRVKKMPTNPGCRSRIDDRKTRATGAFTIHAAVLKPMANGNLFLIWQ